MTSVSRGPEVSRDETGTGSLVPATASQVCSPAVDVPSCSSPAFNVDDLQSGVSTIRRKGSLVPALPITTTTTRLLSQQSRSGKDDATGSPRADVHHVARSSELPLPPTSATTTYADQRTPGHSSNQPTDGGTLKNQARATPTLGHRPPVAAGNTSPLDLPSPPTSASTIVVDPRIPVHPPNPPVENGAHRATNRGHQSPAHRSTATTQGIPPRTASARTAPDASGHGSPARPKPAPPKRSETTKLSTPDPRQTKAFIMNLDRVITLKNCKGSGGLATLPVPLPPRPSYVDGPTYLDTDDLPPPPAELLEGLRSMRRQAMPLPPIPSPGRR